MADALDITAADWTVGEVVTAAKMNTELRDKILAVAARLSDGGWKDIALLATSGMTEKVNCQYRIKAGVVYLRGAVGFTGSGWFDIGDLPPEACPSVSNGYPASANSGVTMTIMMNSNGRIQGYFNATSGAWLYLGGVSFPLG